MLDIRVNRKTGTPLYAQVHKGILQDIKSGALKPGDRLPAVASLARQLKVTHSTIRRAYEELSKEGRVVSHVGRGTFVTEPNSAAANPIIHPVSQAPTAREDPELAMATRRLRMGVAKSLDALQGLAGKPGLIRFISGIPPASSLREGVLEELFHKAMASGQGSYAGYSHAAGMPELRQAIAERFGAEGHAISPDQVLITSGSQQAISLLGQSALESSRRIICEVPCYMGVPRAFGALGHWVETLVRDKEGPIPAHMEGLARDRPAMLYLCPKLHNPMGTDISAQRLQSVVRWAQSNDAIIIADEIFHDLRFDNVTAPSVLSEMGADRTVVVGSLSKSFMCGLRIGWLVSTAQRIEQLTALRRATDIGSPPLMQGIALELLRTGEYDDHVRRVRRLYQIRRDATLRALKQYMPEGVTWTRPPGGFHMWVELPPGYSSLVLFLLGIERGVAFIPGPQCDVDHRFVNCFHLCYACLRAEQIIEGVKRLADATQELLRRPAGDTGLSEMGGFG